MFFLQIILTPIADLAFFTDPTIYSSWFSLSQMSNYFHKFTFYLEVNIHHDYVTVILCSSLDLQLNLTQENLREISRFFPPPSYAPDFTQILLDIVMYWLL